MDLGDIMHLALADATARLRADRPDWFAQVDAIKAGPGWKPFASTFAGARGGRVDYQFAERGHPFPRI